MAINHVNKADLENMIKNVHMVTGLRIAVFDEEFHELAKYPSCYGAFCSMIRTDKDALEKCCQSDVKAFEMCRKTGKVISYQCHAGLLEVACPIRQNNLTIGYLMFGALLNVPVDVASWKDISDRCREYDVDMAALEPCFYQLTQFKVEKINALCQILEACASYLWLNKIMDIRQDSLMFQIENFITNNIASEITAETLCNQFAICRTTLFKMVKQYSGKSLGCFIREKQISKAKELLIGTDYMIKDIANIVGVFDCNYFTKIFKIITGQTPRDYRKQYE